MISRTHGLVLSLLLGAASAAGAYALIGTAKLTDAQTKPELVSSRQIAKRAHKLDEWGASLTKALASKPPALTPLNRYAAVSAGPLLGVASMPTVANPPTSAAQQTRAPTRKKIPRGPAKKPAVSVAAQTRDVDAPRPRAPIAAVADDEPEHGAAAPAAPPAAAPVTAPVTVAARPVTTSGKDTQNTPAPPVTPSPSQSAERQCEALKQAAEGKGEQAKKDAERQCEALKQAAERATGGGG